MAEWLNGSNRMKQLVGNILLSLSYNWLAWVVALAQAAIPKRELILSVMLSKSW